MLASDEQARNTRLALAILCILFSGVLFFNAGYWVRYAHVKTVYAGLQDGTCEIKDPSFQAGWKMGWHFPFWGQAWTEVPCTCHVDAWLPPHGQVAKADEPTKIIFIYGQNFVWNVLSDNCKNMVKKQMEKGRFNCSLFVEDGQVQDAFDSAVAELPNKPLLLLMRASGLSLATLGPMVALAFLCARGALKERSSGARTAVGTAAVAPYEPLAADERCS